MPSSFSLGPYFEEYVRRKVRSGGYAFESEVAREGLGLMEQRDREREARLEALRATLLAGRESGPGIAADRVFAAARTRIDEVEAKQSSR